MAKKLIIVESPAKTKTLKGFLGSDYQVEASMGHVRDLPEKKLSIDIENDFAPTYVIIPERKDVVAKLMTAAKNASEVFLASDPDREGEAISWHLQEALGLKNARRIQFNEITKPAVQAALLNSREIDMDRVNAQQARRELDRIVGYKISPILAKKVRPRLSAGRVQSVAVRLIADREREILAFKPVEYWSITANLTPDTARHKFDAALLLGLDGKKLTIPNQDSADGILKDLDGAEYKVRTVKRSEKRRNAAPPFITSTLQQEASRKLGYNAKKTMQVAQKLYEGVDVPGEGHVGLITYMRTDSTRIADEAQAAARQLIVETYGPKYAPGTAKQFKKAGAAQDAHEAIRPTDVRRLPERVLELLSSEQARLYKLIWQRFVASQMSPAVFDVVTVDIGAAGYTFRATGSTVKFDGFLRVYSEGKDDAKVEDEEKQPLPPLTDGQLLKLLALTPKQHFTEPPPRFTEATLVKALEEKGIGRPSTYASIIATIQDRQYVELAEKKFKPTELGLTVNDLLVKHFPGILDVTFTAGMEAQLDAVAEGKEDWVQMMRRWYDPFAIDVKKAGTDMETVKKPPREAGIECPTCGKPMVVRESRYGEFVSCSDYPKCKTIVRPEPTESQGDCPKCGKPMLERAGRFGKFIACTDYPECKTTKQPAAQRVDVPCPKCGGEIVQKRSKKGAVFFGCNNYPKCDFVAWGKPVGRNCPKCESVLVENTFRGGRVSGIKCHNSECDYKEAAPPKKQDTDTDDLGERTDADAPPAERELAAV